MYEINTSEEHKRNCVDNKGNKRRNRKMNANEKRGTVSYEMPNETLSNQSSLIR